ncbi:MAG: phosphoribosylglycinamide formyltransferase [Clostridia bacterium]
MKRLAVFVSGSGSDLQSVIDAIETGFIENAKIELVVSSKYNVFALERASRHNILSKVFSKSDFKSSEELFSSLECALNELKIDYIVLAGYLSIIPESFVKAFENRIINIHPSLIPKFCGDGFYGMRVHSAVIEAKETESGATVHFVDGGTDTGKIILQEKVAVLPNDTAETLQLRVLELEHKLLPKAVKLLVDGKIK